MAGAGTGWKPTDSRTPPKGVRHSRGRNVLIFQNPDLRLQTGKNPSRGTQISRLRKKCKSQARNLRLRAQTPLTARTLGKPGFPQADFQKAPCFHETGLVRFFHPACKENIRKEKWKSLLDEQQGCLLPAVFSSSDIHRHGCLQNSVDRGGQKHRPKRILATFPPTDAPRVSVFPTSLALFLPTA